MKNLFQILQNREIHEPISYQNGQLFPLFQKEPSTVQSPTGAYNEVHNQLRGDSEELLKIFPFKMVNAGSYSLSVAFLWR